MRGQTAITMLFFGSVVGCAASGGLNPDYLASEAMDTDAARHANDLAIEHIRRGDPQRAMDAVRQAVLADPTFGPAHNNLAKLHFQQGNLIEAWREFEEAARLMPERPEPMNNLGLVLESAERLDEALLMYRNARELEPDNAEFAANLARVKLRLDQVDQELKSLLRELLLIETRPAWRDWARATLARLEANADDSQNVVGKLPDDASSEPSPSPLVLNSPADVLAEELPQP